MRARLDLQIELQLATDSVHPFAIPAVAFHVAQIQEEQAITLVGLVVCEVNEVVGDLDIF
ncbi:hypothetical protein LCGC14_0543070 [marine sediment metagenome]|uniref:Uncharacterized protein n=1 Tax=marine sediment metagenome TaxID=412755 RepID=A0A0F9RWZ1_9ZZZZ